MADESVAAARLRRERGDQLSQDGRVGVAHRVVLSDEARQLEVEAAEGSQLTWRIEVEDPAERVSLLLDEVSRIDLALQGEGRWSGGLSLRSPHVYVVEVERRGAETWRSPYSRLGVIVDGAPTSHPMSSNSCCARGSTTGAEFHR